MGPQEACTSGLATAPKGTIFILSLVPEALHDLSAALRAGPFCKPSRPPWEELVTPVFVPPRNLTHTWYLTQSRHYSLNAHLPLGEYEPPGRPPQGLALNLKSVNILEFFIDVDF